MSEPLAIHETDLSYKERRARAIEILDAVGMGADALDRYPHEFSGGQRQRIGIRARVNFAVGAGDRG